MAGIALCSAFLAASADVIIPVLLGLCSTMMMISDYRSMDHPNQ